MNFMLVLTFRQFITESISDTKVTGALNNNVVLNTLKTLFSGAPRARGAPLLRKFGNLSSEKFWLTYTFSQG